MCSLTVQREDISLANLVASSLCGDGAAAVIATGGGRAPAGPKLLATDDISTWIVHAAGPKVIDAVQDARDPPADALISTRNSLRDNGNLSSVSVLDILHGTMADPPPPGSVGLMIAMGPGFSAELVLLSW